MACLANELWPKKELNLADCGSSPASALVPSGRVPPKLRSLKLWQYAGWPPLHGGHVSQ